jgi:hypothetical protein
MNNIAMVAGIIATGAGGGAVYHYAATPPGEYYAVPLGVAYARVAQDAEKNYAAAGSDEMRGLQIDLKLTKLPNQEIRWHISLMGKPLLEIAAKFAADGSGTRIDYDYVMNTHGPFKNTAEVINDSGVLEDIVDIASQKYFAQVVEGKTIDEEALKVELQQHLMGSGTSMMKTMGFVGRLRSAIRADMEANGFAKDADLFFPNRIDMGRIDPNDPYHSELLDHMGAEVAADRARQEGLSKVDQYRAQQEYRGQTGGAAPSTDLSQY